MKFAQPQIKNEEVDFLLYNAQRHPSDESIRVRSVSRETECEDNSDGSSTQKISASFEESGGSNESCQQINALMYDHGENDGDNHSCLSPAPDRQTSRTRQLNIEDSASHSSYDNERNGNICHIDEPIYCQEDKSPFIFHLQNPLSSSENFSSHTSTIKCHDNGWTHESNISHHLTKRNVLKISNEKAIEGKNKFHKKVKPFSSSFPKIHVSKYLFVLVALWVASSIILYHHYFVDYEEISPDFISRPLQQNQINGVPATVQISKNPAILNDEFYTIRVTAKSHLLPVLRPNLILTSVESHAKCEKVKEIQVIWMGNEIIPMELKKMDKVRIVRNNEDNIEPENKAVILLDDDLVFDCEELNRAFNLWSHNPERLIGFFALSHKPDIHYSPPGSQYTLITSRAAILHRAYLQNLIPTHPSCLLVQHSLRITTITQKGPLRIYGKPKELRNSNVMTRVRRKDEQNDVESIKECLDMHFRKTGFDIPVENMTYFGV